MNTCDSHAAPPRRPRARPSARPRRLRELRRRHRLPSAPPRPPPARPRASEHHDRGHGGRAVRRRAARRCPTDGKGSFDGMATDPVATAASNNPLLSTLVTAVERGRPRRDPELGPGHHRLRADQRRVRRGPARPPWTPRWPTRACSPRCSPTTSSQGKLAPDELAGDHKTLGRHDDHGRGLRRGLHRRRGQRDLRQRADRQRHGLHHRRRPAAPAEPTDQR